MVNTSVNSNNTNSFLYYVYGLMSFGLGLTAIVSYFVAQNKQFVFKIQQNSMLLFGLFFVQLALVFALSFFINRISAGLATIIFIVYSILNGITLSSIFLIYEFYSIAITFLVTALMFAVLAIYGFVTKRDLSGMGSILLMAIVGLIISGLVNLYFKSQTLSYITSAAGVLIFSLLTVYDMQQIKNIRDSLLNAGEPLAKISIVSALRLYLDFLNLFLSLLQFFGQRRKE